MRVRGVALGPIDDVLQEILPRLPGIRYLAWNMVIWGTRPTSVA